MKWEQYRLTTLWHGELLSGVYVPDGAATHQLEGDSLLGAPGLSFLEQGYLEQVPSLECTAFLWSQQLQMQ